MSLILEALRKLEREKQTPQRGVIVLGQASPAGASGERRLALFLAGLTLGAAALGVGLWRSRPATPATQVARAPAAVAVDADAARSGSSALAAPRPTAASLPQPPRRDEIVMRPAAATVPAAPASGAPAPAFTLQAISEREGKPVAIVNDRLLREGDSVDGAKIVRIAKDEVELELQGRRLTLRF